MIRIRRVTILDLQKATELCRTYWHEAKDTQPLSLPEDGFDDSLCMERIANVCMDGHELYLVAEDMETGKFVGMFWFTIIIPLWSDRYYASEQYFYVLPEYRNTTVAHRLLTSAKDIAKLAGCSFLQVANLTKDEKLERTYSKRCTKLGTCYIFPFAGVN